MSEILDSLATTILLGVIAWLSIMATTSAALAYHLRWRPGLGALLGLIPIPFVGWIIVWLLAGPGRSVRQSKVFDVASAALASSLKSDSSPTTNLDL